MPSQSRKHPVLPITEFLSRYLRHLTFAFLILGFSLLVGIVGYHYIVGLNGIDAFLNASMILSGMGPVNAGQEISSTAKFFEGCYAIYSGVSFISTVGYILAPIAHRVLHRFHIDEED